jgi:hypothetical protein
MASIAQRSVATTGAIAARSSSLDLIVQPGPLRKESSSTKVPSIFFASARASVVLPWPLHEPTMATREITSGARR